jgi:hypothetical protein
MRMLVHDITFIFVSILFPSKFCCINKYPYEAISFGKSPVYKIMQTVTMLEYTAMY